MQTSIKKLAVLIEREMYIENFCIYEAKDTDVGLFLPVTMRAPKPECY